MRICVRSNGSSKDQVTFLHNGSKLMFAQFLRNPVSKIQRKTCKLYERHFNSLLLQQIGSSLDKRHFGSVKDSSTTCALVDLMKFLLSSTDDPNNLVRLCFYDLSKGFDRVDHNILIEVVRQFDVHPALVRSITSFLTGRSQRVCLDGISSEWKPVPAGIPQCGVLAPTLFLIMVNSLAHRESWCWKYMDDITLGETLRADVDISSLQEKSNDICREVHDKKMQLNPTKCKEMLVCFKRKTPTISNITIDDRPIALRGRDVTQIASVVKEYGRRIDDCEFKSKTSRNFNAKRRHTWFKVRRRPRQLHCRAVEVMAEV
ncbi:RNA-directed DNA polymerase from mobile element jockey [Exaiptasia diaphana]|nr:RNA-directed DNA polymerase from mobile element jockey [Exaiptasia diaphana]